MKKIILIVLLLIVPFCIYSQFKIAEKLSTDSLFKSGKLNRSQTNQLYNIYIALSYPEFKLNSNTGEIEISDTLTFVNIDNKIIFKRCLEWIAINYGNLVYNDLESGKIIAHGLIDLNHYQGNGYDIGIRNIQQIQTSTNYTLILTINDKKIKYIITNITYNFKNFSETIDEISYPMSQLYQNKVMDQHWLKFFTILNASSEMFNSVLKNSLVNYINYVSKDYQF